MEHVYDYCCTSPCFRKPSWTFMDPKLDPRMEIKGRMVQNTLNPFIQKGLTDPKPVGFLYGWKFDLKHLR